MRRLAACLVAVAVLDPVTVGAQAPTPRFPIVPTATAHPTATRTPRHTRTAVVTTATPGIFLPLTYSFPPPTATPRPIPTATPKAGAPWRREWRRRTAQEVVEQFWRDSLPAGITSRSSYNEDGVHCDFIGVRTVGRRPQPAADLVVVDCYNVFSRDMMSLAIALDEDLDGSYHRNTIFSWPLSDPVPVAYIASYLAECAADPYCDPEDGELVSARTGDAAWSYETERAAWSIAGWDSVMKRQLLGLD